jgi:hypothetical protein
VITSAQVECETRLDALANLESFLQQHGVGGESDLGSVTIKWRFKHAVRTSAIVYVARWQGE